MAIDITSPTRPSSASAGSGPIAVAATGSPSMLTGRLTVTVMTTVSQNGGRRSREVTSPCAAQRSRSPMGTRAANTSSSGAPNCAA
jgi:hypothetical protein